ncbi:hypothetical protein B296_00058299 [Ensete ventricosum]|uniref:Uncharacterized protein n=1 Tax=Ensete ventricosum TaxID=4639 RepID=A0A426WZ51_ENSVE|nr:hypothetical protein B296_00058299 [Ensete ventricosum]
MKLMSCATRVVDSCVKEEVVRRGEEAVKKVRSKASEAGGTDCFQVRSEELNLVSKQCQLETIERIGRAVDAAVDAAGE